MMSAVSLFAMVLVLIGVLVILLCVAPATVALLGSGEMDGRGTGKVTSVVPRIVQTMDGEMACWTEYGISMRIDGRDEELFVWAPEWYDSEPVGSEVGIAYSTEDPSECMLDGVVDASRDVVDLGLRIGLASVAVGACLDLVSLAVG